MLISSKLTQLFILIPLMEGCENLIVSAELDLPWGRKMASLHKSLVYGLTTHGSSKRKLYI